MLSHPSTPEKMNCYPRPLGPPPSHPTADPVQLRILETLLEEKQLLIDLNGAVEALTSALLAVIRREDRRS